MSLKERLSCSLCLRLRDRGGRKISALSDPQGCLRRMGPWLEEHLAVYPELSTRKRVPLLVFFYRNSSKLLSSLSL